MRTHYTANFTEINSITAALFSNMGLEMESEPSDHPSFIRGRCAGVKATDDNKSIEGFFGELHPQVITNFNLEYPTVALEVEFTDSKKI